ncbi:hypothetical protein [Buttiauxella agrestis]|uniref:hypothetical protein n=1 Tax=Buttiauxella agrestis TaxID=82977 RepID=UPI0015615954|nr:hypothetical protein [Buttiauxella agrestis]BCG08762.1 hypothetical protein BADSM9389_14210 [Buttiauxella agrestis]
MKVVCSIILVILCGISLLQMGNFANYPNGGSLVFLGIAASGLGMYVRWQWARRADAFTVNLMAWTLAISIALTVGFSLFVQFTADVFIMTPYAITLAILANVLSMALFAALATPWRREAKAEHAAAERNAVN